jgi:hypothetical protein
MSSVDISSCLNDLIELFASSMANEGKPQRDRMIARLEKLWDKAVADRNHEVIALVEGKKWIFDNYKSMVKK